ncbi:TetR/AcrR family transcriptional regulator [Actinocorallia populi]|uniref:TetR/AcrR family transcriptional regulator n=1 Tax=Actinocorallia populi TaxID=2079200 RepID=UPI000D08EB90|nr:TetR/AcrR family transcriptional regulator [Actinocorallia populi]
MDERVLETAGRLFAELGYDGTDLELIAAAVGRGSQESSLMREGKEKIYRAVIARFSDRDLAHLQEAMKETPHDVAGLHHLVDAFLDFVFSHPEVPGLWEQRALKDAVDLTFPEEEFVPPLLTVLTAQAWEGVRLDLDLRFLGWLLMWSARGFVHGGLPDRAGEQRRADDPDTRRYFRDQMHSLVDRLV